jgi:hypothetical protein
MARTARSSEFTAINARAPRTPTRLVDTDNSGGRVLAVVARASALDGVVPCVHEPDMTQGIAAR